MITAIRNHIVFKFVDKINVNNQFVRDDSNGGIILGASFDESAKGARWATIVSAGPDTSPILKQPNIQVLIDSLKWTDASMIEGIGKVWRTDETHILGYKLV